MKKIRRFLWLLPFVVYFLSIFVVANIYWPDRMLIEQVAILGAFFTMVAFIIMVPKD